jgi:hypothetical protein
MKIHGEILPMFGFLRSRQGMLTRSDSDKLSGHFCGLCHALRHDYIPMAGLLAGMEGRFLAVLIDAQTKAPALQQTKRCPVNAWQGKLSMTGGSTATRFAAAVTVFLFEQKLVDDVLDDRSLCAKLALQIFRKHFAKAKRILSEMSLPLYELLFLKKRQHNLEYFEDKADLESVSEPSGTAVGILLAHTAILAGAPKNRRILREIGDSLGRSITLMDACQDFDRDKKRKRYNAIEKAFGCKLSSDELFWILFDRIENYLLVHLQSIRLKIQQLSLRRHRQIIQNILMFGLYDEATKALNHLSAIVSAPPIFFNTEQKCTSCGLPVKSPFCPNCGTNRLFGRLSTIQPNSASGACKN